MLNAIRVTDLEFEWVGSRTFADKSLPNGAFELYTSMEDNGFVGMVYVCPCGCRRTTSLSFAVKGSQRGWTWNGNENRPTLSPSIWAHKTCGWHGFLIDGVWQNV